MVISGDVSSETNCASDGTFSAEVDISSIGTGNVKITVYQSNYYGVSSASRTFVKTNTDCDNASDRLPNSYCGSDGRTGSGIGDEFFIATKEQLIYLSQTSSDWDKFFMLKNNINLKDTTIDTIGNSTTNFTGDFDGSNFTISNLTQNFWNPSIRML